MSDNTSREGATGPEQPAAGQGGGFLVVGLGASAGGVQALNEFFARVAAPTWITHVVILHLSPEHEGRLAEVLRAAAPLPVTRVTEAVRVEPDHVYVVPQNYSLTIGGGSGAPTVYAAEIARDHTEGKELEDALLRAREELEERIRERTMELAGANVALQSEVRERAAAEERIKNLLRQLVTVQEDERRRIARDLHDHLGQQMTALRLNLEALKQDCGGDAPAREKVEQAQSIAARVDAGVDFLAWGLRAAALDDLGLAAGLADLVKEFSKQFGVQAEFHRRGLARRRLLPEIETNLYRIAQEALNNVHKHAAASKVDVLLETRDGQVVLIVEDDGRGFDLLRASAGRKGGRGMGLVGMRERAALVGGTVEIETAPGEGTTVFVRVPAEFARRQTTRKARKKRP